MRSSRIAVVAALLVVPIASAQAQLRNVDVMLGSSAGVISSPVECETCQDITFTHTVGLRFFGRYGIAYRAVRLHDDANGSSLLPDRFLDRHRDSLTR